LKSNKTESSTENLKQPAQTQMVSHAEAPEAPAEK
jgi:hypothetical protein